MLPPVLSEGRKLMAKPRRSEGLSNQGHQNRYLHMWGDIW